METAASGSELAAWEHWFNWERRGGRLWKPRNFMHGWWRAVIAVEAMLWTRPAAFCLAGTGRDERGCGF